MGHRRGGLWIGTSGFAYAHWSGLLYLPGLPKRRWLDRYAEVFSTLKNNGHGHALYDARDLSIELGVPLPLALPEERLVE